MWYELPAVLLLAALLDFLIGDPWGWPHPVQVMGEAIGHYRHWVFKWVEAPRAQRLAGVALGIGLIGGSAAVGWGLVAIATQIHAAVGMAVQGILLASCLAGRSLRRAAEDVLHPLEAGDVVMARRRLRLYVGRDTDDLTAADILRAVVETVSENTTDGVTAPLFYGVLGALVPGLGPVPAALGYKAASTLDSMVGYQDWPYRYLGWFSARLEDGLTWLPCRLTVLTLALMSRRPLDVLQICRRDATADPSPNAGWSECAYAAVLGVQLGGANRYRGQIKIKPKLGDDRGPITPTTVRSALQLTRRLFLLWLGLALLLVGVVHSG